MQVTQKINIRSLTKLQLIECINVLDEQKFRGLQVYDWLWKKSARRFSEMTNLPQSLRLKLETQFEIDPLKIDLQQKSSDGTIKCRFILHDGYFIEGVLIPSNNRITACVSSQVGCNLGCRFCATGYMKLKRNLEPWEIYDQVVLLRNISTEHYKQPLTNIVFMGMGEPLLNYKNVLLAIDKLTSEQGLGISPKRITVSTAGLAKLIKKLGDDKVKFNLALSLHAADDKKRSALMPVNDANGLDELMDALNYFYQKTGNRITFEYILFDGINDKPEDAQNLVKLCRKVPARVNIIEYNSIREAEYGQSAEGQREYFIKYLETQNIIAKVRRSRGKDIDAACGQLANK
jgi:23S rRNA (adenine2503-C2)-methyltransferase